MYRQPESSSSSSIVHSLEKLRISEVKPITPMVSGAGRIPFEELKFGARLGEGGTAEVFQGTYRGDPVAIKLFKIYSGFTPDWVQQEADIMRRLRGPYLVDYRGLCVSPRYCLVMEYCGGGALRERLDNPSREVTFVDRLRWSTQISWGVGRLHDFLIIHRDLKTENILLSQSDDAKVSDLGYACEWKNDRAKSEVCGTFYWRAPELFAGKPNSFESDIFSLGMVLWEILTGKSPYKELFLAGLSEEANNRMWTGQGEVLPSNCPKIFESMIRVCWNLDPIQRPKAVVVGEEFNKAWKSLTSLPRIIAQEEKQLIPDADFKQGIIHYLKEQYSEALPYFKKSAQKNYPPAYLYLGIIGEGSISENYYQQARAHFLWFQAQAATGIAEHQYHLALYFEFAAGQEKNPERAEFWYLKAAEQGFMPAQINLALYFHNIKQDDKAMLWLHKAATQGSTTAGLRLGYHFFYGWGVAKNEENALKCFKVAGRDGNPRAQYELGAHYFRVKAYQEAALWYQRAADGGDVLARDKLDSLKLQRLSSVSQSVSTNAYTIFRTQLPQSGASHQPPGITLR